MSYELRPPEAVNVAGQPTTRGHLSNSSLNTFLACQQRFAFHYEQRLDPAVTAEPLAMGRAFAEALEHGDPEAGATVLLEQAVKQADEAAGNPWLVVPDPQEVEVQATVVREASRAYLSRYGTHDQTREVELRARIRNPASGGRYSMTHDLLCRVDAVSADHRDLFEDKLVSQIPRRSLTSKLKLDRQVSIETYMVWRCTGVAPERVHYRYTKKPGIRRRKDESHEGYLKRIAEEYATRPDEYLHEEILTRSHDDFLRLERELWNWTEAIRVARKDGLFPRNTASCEAFSGCRYLALCAGEPGAEHQYVQREVRLPRVAA